jgi:hypothetical protein
MRRAATLVHALPGLRLRLRYQDEVVLAVTRPPLPDGPAVTPCAFRNAVARAHVQLQEGQRLRFLGLPEGVAPALEVGTGPGDRCHPGGLYEVRVAGATVHAFVSVLRPQVCRAAVGGPPGTGPDVRLHHDAATGVTVVHAVDPPGADPAPTRLLLEELLARCAAEEVAREVSALGAVTP